MARVNSQLSLVLGLGLTQTLVVNLKKSTKKVILKKVTLQDLALGLGLGLSQSLGLW